MRPWAFASRPSLLLVGSGGGSPPLPVVPGGSPPAFLFGFRLGAAPRLFFVSLLRSQFLALPRVKCVPAMYLPNLIMSASTTSTRGCCSTWASSVRTMVTCGSPHTFVTRAMVPYGFHSSACVSVVYTYIMCFWYVITGVVTCLTHVCLYPCQHICWHVFFVFITHVA